MPAADLKGVMALPLLQQTWSDLLFIHWEVPARELKPLLPRALALDTYEGRAWVGVTPFVLSGLRLRGMPPIPGLSRFPELNLRTYVVGGGRPGVYFFSLDAGNGLAVAGARRAFLLPYYRARMEVRREGDAVLFFSRRRRSGAAFAASYRPIGPAFRTRPGSLDFWLTERYCFFTADRWGRVYRGDIRHRPWELQPASAEISASRLAAAAGITLPSTDPLLHYSRQLRVAAWTLARAHAPAEAA